MISNLQVFGFDVACRAVRSATSHSCTKRPDRACTGCRYLTQRVGIYGCSYPAAMVGKSKFVVSDEDIALLWSRSDCLKFICATFDCEDDCLLLNLYRIGAVVEGHTVMVDYFTLRNGLLDTDGRGNPMLSSLLVDKFPLLKELLALS